MAALEGTLNNKFASINHKHNVTDETGAPNMTPNTLAADGFNQKFVTPGSYSFTVPPKVTEIKVTTVGAGGGGSGCAGGGGGAVTENISVAVSPGGTVNVQVGASTATSDGGPSYIAYNGNTYAYSGGGKRGSGYTGGASGGVGGSNGGGCADRWERNFNCSNGSGTPRYGTGSLAYGYHDGQMCQNKDSGNWYQCYNYYKGAGTGGSWSASNGTYGVGGRVGCNNTSIYSNISAAGSGGAVWITYNNVEQHYTGPAIQDNPVVEPTYDPNTLLLLHGEDFTDSSQYGRAVTNNGSAITADGKFGKAMSFNGSNSYLKTNPFTFGITDFTFEAWVKLSAFPTSDAWPSSYTNHMVIAGVGTPNLGDGIDLILGSTHIMMHNNDSQFIYGPHNMSLNKWHHLAAVRSGNIFILFVDGIKKAEVSVNITAGTGSDFWIGTETGEGAYLNGVMDELRISNIARWTTDFTPPSAPYSE